MFGQRIGNGGGNGKGAFLGLGVEGVELEVDLLEGFWGRQGRKVGVNFLRRRSRDRPRCCRVGSWANPGGRAVGVGVSSSDSESESESISARSGIGSVSVPSGSSRGVRMWGGISQWLAVLSRISKVSGSYSSSGSSSSNILGNSETCQSWV